MSDETAAGAAGENPPARRRPHPALRALRAILLAYLLAIVLAAALYPRLLYHPTRAAPDLTPADFGVDYEEVWLTASDGVRLHGWLVRAAVPARGRKKTVLAFHGNAGNLSTAVHRLVLYSRLGCDALMVDYPGFGASGGSPSEEGLYGAAETAWNHLIRERGAEPGDVVILGYSLGGAVAAWLAERNPGAAGLVLESTFTRLSDVASDLFPFLPCSLILGDAYDTAGRLPRIAMPLLVVHGAGDELVAFKFGEELFAAYGGEKRFLRIGDDHNVGFLGAGDSYSHGLAAFLEALGGDPPAVAPAGK